MYLCGPFMNATVMPARMYEHKQHLGGTASPGYSQHMFNGWKVEANLPQTVSPNILWVVKLSPHHRQFDWDTLGGVKAGVFQSLLSSRFTTTWDAECNMFSSLTSLRRNIGGQQGRVKICSREADKSLDTPVMVDYLLLVSFVECNYRHTHTQTHSETLAGSQSSPREANLI